MTDTELRPEVLNELKWEPSVDAAHIGVSVKHCIVPLTGHVSPEPEKYAAERAGKRVYGVKAVANELELPEQHSPASLQRRFHPLTGYRTVWTTD